MYVSLGSDAKVKEGLKRINRLSLIALNEGRLMLVRAVLFSRRKIPPACVKEERLIEARTALV
jgi:hypothetical protein